MKQKVISQKRWLGRLIARPVLITWCLSYALILVISSSVSVYNHHRSNQIIMDEIASINNLALEGLKNQADTTLETLSYVSNAVLSDPQVSSLVASNAARFARDALNCMELFRQFRHSNLDLSILCFSPLDQTILSYETANSVQMLFPVVQNKLSENTSLAQWIDTLSVGASGGRYLIADNLSYSNVGKPSFVYAARKSGIADNERYVNLYVSLPCETLSSLGENASFAVVDASGDVLWGWNLQELAPDVLKDACVLGDSCGTFHIDVADENTSYICTYTQSDINPLWYYMQIVPSAAYFEHAHSLVRTLATSLVLATLVGLILIVAIVHHNYAPLSKLVKMAEAASGEPGRIENEYDIVRGIVINLQSENRSMREETNLLRERLLDKYLLSLLIGRREMQPDAGIVSQVEQTMRGNQVQILVMRFVPPEAMRDLSYYDTMGFAVENILAELLTDQCSHFHLWDGGYLVYLFAANETAMESLDGVIMRLHAVFDRAFPQVLTLVVCDPVSDAESLSIAYAEALGAMQYMADAGGSGLIRTRDLRGRTGSNDDTVQATSGVWVRKLVESVRRGESAEAEYALKMLMELTCSLSLPEPMLRHSLIALLNEPIGAFLSAFESDEEEKRLLDEKIEQLNAQRVIPELYAQMTELIKHLCLMVQRYSSERAIGFAERISAYIDANYTDPNLNITAIADVMGVSSKTVSTRFRQATGEGILDYIAKVRVDHAKRIARDQQLSVERISEMVGYTSVKTFRRAFAKVEGATPGKFFQQLAQDDLEEI